MKVYTKNGDLGTTKTANQIVSKSSCLIEANGVIDELQSAMDKVIYGLDILPDIESSQKRDFCMHIQSKLRQLGGEISGIKTDSPITIDDVEALEIQMDTLDEDVWEFVRFTHPIAMDIDEARVRTRKAERVLTAYLEQKTLSQVSYMFMNRLSDFFFVLSVHIDRIYGE